MNRPARFACGVVVILAVASSPPAALGQVLEGRVSDGASGAGIGDARITVLTDQRSLFDVVTDSLGAFRIALSEPGVYALRVERLGYEAVTTDTLSVADGQLLEVELRLGPDPLPIESLVVVSRRTTIDPLAEYHRRLEWGRKTGFGRFVTRQDLDAVRMPFLSSYLSRAGVMLATDRRGMSHPVLRGRCRPAVYLNGVALDLGGAGGSIDEMFAPDDVEGLEVYSGIGEIPVEYARPGVCGVIVVWSRIPEGGAPLSGWRSILAGSMVLGLLVLLVTF